MNKIGKLYIVATPIGNMEDITFRAVKVLNKADIIAAEDTRHTARLLSYHNIKANLISCHEHNESYRTSDLIQKLKNGKSVALVSDAGTPGVSDPGFRLIQKAVEKDILIIPIPGASAAVTALSVAGLPTDSFIFMGFPPKKKSKRINQLETLKQNSQTLIFYESPKRILEFIQDIIEIMGDRYAVFAREMTKVHEEFIRGNLSHILEVMNQRNTIKGECTLLISGKEKQETVSIEKIKQEIEKELKLENAKLNDIAKKISKKFRVPKNQVYAQALNLKKGK